MQHVQLHFVQVQAQMPNCTLGEPRSQCNSQDTQHLHLHAHAGLLFQQGKHSHIMCKDSARSICEACCSRRCHSKAVMARRKGAPSIDFSTTASCKLPKCSDSVPGGLPVHTRPSRRPFFHPQLLLPASPASPSPPAIHAAALVHRLLLKMCQSTTERTAQSQEDPHDHDNSRVEGQAWATVQLQALHRCKLSDVAHVNSAGGLECTLLLSYCQQYGRCAAISVPRPRVTGRASQHSPAPNGKRTSRNFARYTFKGSTYSSKPRVLIAQSKSSPFIVFRFSRWHLSLALSQRAHI